MNAVLGSSDSGSAQTAAVQPAALSLVDVVAGYGDTKVLRGVSLTVQQGSVTALVGANGAGKTTLLKAVSGLLPVSDGQVWCAGQDVTRRRADQRAAMGVCHVPEGRGIYRSLTVRDNLIMQSMPRHENEAIEQAAGVFPILGTRLHQIAGTLSGGEQQMLSMASAYVRNPRLIMVDEASLGLAPLIVDKIFEFLQTVAKRGCSLLVVDQYVHRALGMANHAYVMRRGEIVFDGSPAELLDRDLFAEYMS